MLSFRRLHLPTTLALAGVLLLVHFSADVEAAPEQLCGKTISTNSSGTAGLLPGLQKGPCNITIIRDASASGNYTSLLVSNFVMNANDYVIFYDGEGQQQNAVVTVTGSREPFLVVINSTETFITVMLTANNTNSSMTMDYDVTKCQQTLQADQAALVRSPEFLPDRMVFECLYSLNGTVSGLMALSFQTFSLTNATLNITAGGQQSLATGNDLPNDVFISKTLDVTLSVDKVNTSKADFTASLAPISTYCFQNNLTVSGTNVFTLNVPEIHTLGGDCRILVKSANGKSLLLKITTLQLIGSGDRLTIVDGASQGGRVLATLVNLPPGGYMVVSSGQYVSLRLVVDDLPVPGPRTLNITIMEQTGGTHLFTAGNFEMKSPGVTNGSVTEYYVLEAETGQQVQFDLGNGTANQSVVVTAYDGTQPTGNPLVSFKSSHRRFPVVSSGASMLLVATWMNSTQNLNATLTFIKPGCDQVSSANQGSYTLMASPNLTGPCIWTISPPPLAGNATIRLEFTQLALQPNQTLDVYSGVQAAGSLVAHFQANISGQGVTLPRFAIPASAWAQLVFKVNGKNNSNVTQTLIKALYQVQAACGGSLTAKQGHVTSPGFPNQYPLYSLCPWTIPKSAPGRVLFFDFPAFQTAPGHVLKIEESKANETTVVGVYEGSQQPDDLIFASDDSVVVTFSAQNSSSSQLAVGQGFSMDFWALDCGGNMSQSTASFVTPGFPTPPNNTQLCVWIVQLAPDTASPVNILNLTFSLTITGKAKAEDVISVVDGNSLRSPKLNVSWSGDKPVRALSRYNTVIIIYNNTAAAADASTGVALNVSYSTYSCKKDQLCDNGVCMHPDWKCNGHNDCGDGSDERNCSITPAPSKDSGGVKSYWVAICLLIGLLLGVAFTILAPRIIRRFRSQPYTPFRDEPVVT